MNKEVVWMMIEFFLAIPPEKLIRIPLKEVDKALTAFAKEPNRLN